MTRPDRQTGAGSTGRAGVMQEALSRVPGRSPRSSPAERRMAWAANQTQPPETRRRRRRRLGRPRRDGRVGRPAGNLLLSAPLTWTRLGRRFLHWLVKANTEARTEAVLVLARQSQYRGKNRGGSCIGSSTAVVAAERREDEAADATSTKSPYPARSRLADPSG